MSVHDPYAEERAFLATLPGWRRFLARLNWHSPLNDYYPSQDSTHSQALPARNAVKATLLLMLGAGVIVFLTWSQYLLIALNRQANPQHSRSVADLAVAWESDVHQFSGGGSALAALFSSYDQKAHEREGFCRLAASAGGAC
jgi:hypothetical protein